MARPRVSLTRGQDVPPAIIIHSERQYWKSQNDGPSFTGKSREAIERCARFPRAVSRQSNLFDSASVRIFESHGSPVNPSKVVPHSSKRALAFLLLHRSPEALSPGDFLFLPALSRVLPHIRGLYMYISACVYMHTWLSRHVRGATFPVLSGLRAQINSFRSNTLSSL